MPEITRKFEFDAAHRILGHECKCKNLHGHRYVAEVTIQSPGLDSLGRVIDFSAVKSLVGEWIDEHWDHNILLHAQDPLLDLNVVGGDAVRKVFGDKEPYVMHFGANPTAENIAKELFIVSKSLLPNNLELLNVRIWETPNCAADYSVVVKLMENH